MDMSHSGLPASELQSRPVARWHNSTTTNSHNITKTEVTNSHNTTHSTHYNLYSSPHPETDTTELEAKKDRSKQIEKGMKILQPYIVSDALHDSPSCHGRSGCFPNTRIRVLEQIQAWALEPDNTQPILWLSGPLGAGKTSIAQTLSELWQAKGILGASFFFSRTGEGRNDTSGLIPTISYQLYRSFPSIGPAMMQTIGRDVIVFKQSISAQILNVIVSAFQNYDHGEQQMKMIVIDGLDECASTEDDTTHRQILDAFSGALAKHNLPLKLLVASRPEHQIRESFEHRPLKDLFKRIHLDKDWDPDSDIDVYLRGNFEVITRTHPCGPFLGPSWPSNDCIRDIIRRSSGHFIYASVVIKYIRNPHRDPNLSLNKITQLTIPDKHENPYKPLDILYRHILESVDPASRCTVNKTLEVLILYNEIESTLQVHEVPSMERKPLFPNCRESSPKFFENLLLLPLGQIYMHLLDLHSILEVPEPHRARELPIRIIHASFGEFLLDPVRAEDFFIDKKAAHTNLALCLLGYLLANQHQPLPHVYKAFYRHFLEANTSTELRESVLGVLGYRRHRIRLESKLGAKISPTLRQCFASDEKQFLTSLHGYHKGFKLQKWCHKLTTVLHIKN